MIEKRNLYRKTPQPVSEESKQENIEHNIPNCTNDQYFLENTFHYEMPEEKKENNIYNQQYDSQLYCYNISQFNTINDHMDIDIPKNSSKNSLLSNDNFFLPSNTYCPVYDPFSNSKLTGLNNSFTQYNMSFISVNPSPIIGVSCNKNRTYNDIKPSVFQLRKKEAIEYKKKIHSKNNK